MRAATRRYDLNGHTIWRVLLQDAISRLMPFGNFGGGPNLKHVARLLALHTCGRPAIAAAMRLHDLRLHAALWRRRRRDAR